MSAHLWVSAAVEGDVDEAVLTKLAESCGISIRSVFGRMGKGAVCKRLDAYNRAAAHAPWIVLLDLDDDASCAPERVSRLLPCRHRNLCFRIAVRAIESWLLADRNGFASYFGLRPAEVPQSTDLLSDPKSKVVDLARRSRKSEIRRELVPRPGSKKPVGPAYSSRMMEFALYHWDPDVAAASSESLRKCRLAMETMAQRLST